MIKNKPQLVQLLKEILTEKFPKKNKLQKNKISKNKVTKNKTRKPKKLKQENTNDMSEFESFILDKMINMGLIAIDDDGTLRSLREPTELEALELTKFENNLKKLPVIIRSKRSKRSKS